MSPSRPPAALTSAESPLPSSRTASSDTRTNILLAAERLFAERGFEAVSLREINLAAGQRNKSAIQYHFRDRNTLIRDLIKYRQSTMNSRRERLLNLLRHTGSDGHIPSLVSAFVLPLADIAADGSTHYLRFLARFRTWDHREIDALFSGSDTSTAYQTKRIIQACLTTLPEWLRQLRVDQMEHYVISMLALAESRRSKDADLGAPYEIWVAELIHTTVAMLTCGEAPKETTREFYSRSLHNRPTDESERG